MKVVIVFIKEKEDGDGDYVPCPKCEDVMKFEIIKGSGQLSCCSCDYVKEARITEVKI